MQVQRIENNFNSNPAHKMRILQSNSIKYATLTARDLIESYLYYSTHRNFVQEFCNSIAKILKSNKACGIWATIKKRNQDRTAFGYVQEFYSTEDPKYVMRLNSIPKNEHDFGQKEYSQEGGNMMRLLIEYAKTIDDVPEENLKLNDWGLASFAQETLEKEFHM